MIEDVKEEDYMPSWNIRWIERRYAQQKDSYQLRTCPHCYNLRYLFFVSADDTDKVPMYRVHCSFCVSDGPKMPTIALAAKAWNYTRRDQALEV